MTLGIKDVTVIRVPRGLIYREIMDRETEGWQLVSQDEYEAVMRRSGGWGSKTGHAVTGLLTLGLTVGLGNLIYAVHEHGKTRQELHIRAIESTPAPAQVDQTPPDNETWKREVAGLIEHVKTKRS